MTFDVGSSDMAAARPSGNVGHDDVMMLALLCEAAAGAVPLVVQGRRGDGWEEAPRGPDRGPRVRALE